MRHPPHSAFYRNFDFLSIPPAGLRLAETGDIRVGNAGLAGRPRSWTASRCSRHCPVHIEPVQQAQEGQFPPRSGALRANLSDDQR